MAPWSAGIVAAAIILLTGFGVMAALSATGRWDTGRGLWDYRAATWGDILLVPALCAVLAMGLLDGRLPPRPSERSWAIAGGALFGISGALVQVSWLAASNPIINWTLPAPHRFSLPGWYHAIFLVATASAIGAAGIVVARRLRSAPARARDEVARGPASATFLGCAIAFGLVLAFDSADSIDTSAGQGSSAGALGSVAFSIALAVVVLGPRRSLRPVLGGVAMAIAIGVGSLLTHGTPG
jgi:hypothetical protein